MFICQHCQQLSAKGERPTRVVVEYRGEPDGYGRQIVREIVTHAACAHQARLDADAAAQARITAVTEERTHVAYEDAVPRSRTDLPTERLRGPLRVR